jgi:hypothetical protein
MDREDCRRQTPTAKLVAKPASTLAGLLQDADVVRRPASGARGPAEGPRRLWEVMNAVGQLSLGAKAEILWEQGFVRR